MRRIHDELERLRVEWHRGKTSLAYEAIEFFCLSCPLAKAGPPFVRMVQRRFAADSLRSMAAAVSAGC